MTTTPDTTTVPTLTDFLDNGGNPRDALGDMWEGFLDDLFLELPMLSAEGRKRRAEQVRDLNATAVENILKRVGEIDAPDHLDRCQRIGLMYAWTADAFDDPTLADRLKTFLTPLEAIQIDDRSLALRSPYPFTLEVPDRVESWSCANCGTVYETAPEVDGDEVFYERAFIIEARESQAELPSDLMFCRACIAAAHYELNE